VEFVRNYRTNPMSQGVPVLILTTESDETLKAQAKAAGATGWLTKPFNQKQLLDALKKVVG
jgi:two-component system chemotaxis response regulator CheY